MAIRNRRGVYSDFDKTKMVDGEFAIVKSGDPDGSGKAVYISFQSGTADRLALFEDLEEYVEEYGGKIDAITKNGEELPIVDKTVNISVPTKTSDLTNDGDGTSKYATEDDTRIVLSAPAGDIVEFSTGGDNMPMKAVEVSMSPIQSLNGYDAPWPAGGGKNLLDAALLKDQAGWNIIPLKVKPDTIYTMSTDKPNDDLYLYFKNTNIAGGGSSDVVYAGHPVTVTSTSDGYVYVPQRRASGTDSFQNYHYQIEEGSTETDYTPYSNICPITGRTGASVLVGSKNMAVLPTESITHRGITFTPNADGTITASGTVTSAGWIYTSRTNVPFSELGFSIGGEVTLSVNDGLRIICEFRDASRTLLQLSPTVPTGIVPSGTTLVNFYYYAASTSSTPVGAEINVIIKPQLERGSTATEWTPSKTTTYPITFTSAGTVYAGTVDLVSGVLTVTHTGFTIEETMNISLESTRFYVGRDDCKRQAVYTPETVRCDRLPTVAFEGEINFGSPGVTAYKLRSNFPGRNWIYFSSGDASITTVAQMKEWLADNPLQVVYELVEPITYNLTPVQVMSLLGENVVWSPDGTISNLKYSADISLVVADLYSKLSS